MSGNRNKSEKVKRFNDFINNIVPKLETKYSVKVYDKFVKIYTLKDTYDYYPMGQKIAKVPKSRKDFFKWSDLTVDDFVNHFLS